MSRAAKASTWSRAAQVPSVVSRCALSPRFISGRAKRRRSPRTRRPSCCISDCRISSAGPPSARGRAGVVEHVLLRNADAPAAGGDLALLHARDQKRREACVADVRELALPPDVLVAGRELYPR